MNWREVTVDELDAVNSYLTKEPLELELQRNCKRFARKPGESDRMVGFDRGVTLRLLRVQFTEDEGFHLVLQEPRNELFLRLSGDDFERLLGNESAEVLGDVMLWAIKKRNQRALHNGTPPKDFGLF